MAVTHVLNDLADLRAIVGEPDRPASSSARRPASRHSTRRPDLPGAGADETLRVNGRAWITRDPVLQQDSDRTTL